MFYWWIYLFTTYMCVLHTCPISFILEYWPNLCTVHSFTHSLTLGIVSMKNSKVIFVTSYTFGLQVSHVNCMYMYMYLNTYMYFRMNICTLFRFISFSRRMEKMGFSFIGARKFNKACAKWAVETFSKQ